jgi:hypothetical protein
MNTRPCYEVFILSLISVLLILGCDKKQEGPPDTTKGPAVQFTGVVRNGFGYCDGQLGLFSLYVTEKEVVGGDNLFEITLIPTQLNNIAGPVSIIVANVVDSKLDYEIMLAAYSLTEKLTVNVGTLKKADWERFSVLAVSQCSTGSFPDCEGSLNVCLLPDP